MFPLNSLLKKLTIEPGGLLALVGKIKTRITKIAIILFMLAVDAPLRICLMLVGFGYACVGLIYLVGGLVLMLAHWQMISEVREFQAFMDFLSWSITGIAGCRVAYRAQPYRYNPPYLDRKIINERTNLILICVLGIACHFYVHWPPIDTFHELHKNFIGPEKLMPYLYTYGFTAGFVYAIAERIILKIAVLALDHTRETPVGEASANTKSDMRM